MTNTAMAGGLTAPAAGTGGHCPKCGGDFELCICGTGKPLILTAPTGATS